MAPAFQKEMTFTYGAPDQISPLVRRLVAPNPSAYTLHGTNCYIVGDDQGDLAIIDPGPDDDAHIDAITNCVGSQKVSAIVITHRHIDHTPAAAVLKHRTGAPVYAFEDEAGMSFGEDSSFSYDVGLRHGDLIDEQGWALKALHTPGHCGDHLCFVLDQENLIFSGDHIMTWASSIIIPPEGTLADFLGSVDLLLKQDFDLLLPGHGPTMRGPRQFLIDLKAHRHVRNEQILRALDRGRSRKEQLVALVYAGTPKALHGAAARTLEAHLIYLEAEGRIKLRNGEYDLI
jgi:glyoxylase-like metal-dependent hydrolase (beta-lactamase superfamily II)